jgi:ribosomal protein S18 acetylase RimI-like enzyme
MIKWRPTISADLPAMLAIAEIVHPDYPEDPAIFAERLALYPAGCLVLEGAGKPIGYIVSHPWHYGEPPRLNSLLGALPNAPTTYYIHDIALLPQARGTGAAADVIDRLIANAFSAALPNLSLVAVNNSGAFWARHGFCVLAVPALERKLRSYDAAARYMVREIA